jgi:carbon storage regulator CsrA
MLVLHRRPGEKVYLELPDGRRVTITVVEFHGRSAVKLGFDAPKDVAIYRPENAWWYEVVKRDDDK